MVVAVMAKEDMVEGAMFIPHINSPEDEEHSWQRPVYTLQTNGGSFT